MVELKVLAGTEAGQTAIARRFPFVIGRDNSVDFRLEGNGVWGRHLELGLQQPDGFRLKVHADARAALNGQPVREAVLRNGDVIEFGPFKLQFALSATRQARFRLREILTWIAFALLCAGQIALIYLLQR